MKPIKFAAGLLGGASALAMASAACAQTASAPATSEIVVTGSRVIANGNNSPTPVTIVSTDQLLQMQPTTINDALNNLPVFQGSRGQTSTPNTTGLYGGGNPATNELNLRNLSPQRTLVLFDGQRLAPSNALGVVDADSIPQELLQRVDVVTGGVSAVYGSDAIAGVVNYITDRNFNGFKADASYGQSNFNDDRTWRAGMAAGMRFADGKAHIEASYNHYDAQGIPHRNLRPYYACSLIGAGDPTKAVGTAANPYEDFCNVHSNQNTYGGLITNGALKGQTFDTNGVLTAFQHGTSTGTTTSEIGGEGPQTGGYSSLKAPVKMDQVFGRFDYDLTETTRFHAAATITWKRDTTFSAPTSENNFVFSTSNAFLPAAYKTAMGTATSFTMSQALLELPLIAQVADVKNMFLNGGFEGKIGKYDWAIDADYSNNIIHDVFNSNINVLNLAAAEDAVINPANGQVVCNASLTNSAFANCVPFNPFGPTNASQAAINYVTQTTHFSPKFDQIEVGGHIGGDIFDLPAGPVKADVSGEYRKQSFSDTSDATPSQLESCTGVRFNCSATTQVYPNAFSPSGTVSQTVKEGALEIVAPIIKDQPFFQDLSINGAVRYTSYDFGGNNWTYKVGVDWHINNDLTIRATQSQDIEAPTLGMLFQPPLTSLGNNLDTLIVPNATYQVTQHNIGNPNLVSEIGHTTTAGVVWRPAAIPGFSLSVDAYHIVVDKALTQIQGQAAQVQTACYVSGGTSPYCALQVRALGNTTNTSPTNLVTGWIDEFINVSTVETYGADIEMNYQRRIFDRPFALRVFTTWQPHLIYTTPGSPTFDYGGVAFPNLVPLQDVPQVQLTANIDYAVTDNFFVDITQRWRSAMILEPSGAFASVISSGANAYATTNLNLSYHFGKTGNEIYLNVRDLFNATPQILAGQSNNPGFPVTDDPDGRFTSVGIRFKY